jgi:hypothetical protein
MKVKVEFWHITEIILMENIANLHKLCYNTSGALYLFGRIPTTVERKHIKR